MEKISRERFIRLGTALGVGRRHRLTGRLRGRRRFRWRFGGGGGGGNAGGQRSGGRGSSQAAEMRKVGGAAIASESEVAPGSAVKFKEGGQDAILVHLKSGDFVAYSAICTHQQCTVAYKGGKLACPCHGSVFDPANGAEVVARARPRARCRRSR